MVKVAIVTLYGETNFGNRLQNYALETFLKSFGIKCESLIFCERISLLNKAKKNVKCMLSFLNLKKNEYSREKSFKKFSGKYISTRIIKQGYDLKKLSYEYDFFIVGSDQVWNPTFGKYEKYFDRFFLTFVPKEKKIAFAPSFGIKKIPEVWKKKIGEGIASFKYLSAREESGVNIIKELTCMDATLLADPTLLIPVEKWLQLTKINSNNQKYSVSYFLGLKPSIKCDNILNIDLLDKQHGYYYKYNPIDFLSLIRDASIVYTDSFHACVFSILFDIPFCVYLRQDKTEDMSSRIRNLLNSFGIEQFEYGKIITIDCKIKKKALLKMHLDAANFVHASMGKLE